MQDWLSSLSNNNNNKSTIDRVDLDRKDDSVYDEDEEVPDFSTEPRTKVFRAHMEGLLAEFENVAKENHTLLVESQEIRAELARITNAAPVGEQIEGLCSSRPPLAVTDGSGHTPRMPFFAEFIGRPDASSSRTAVRKPSISSNGSSAPSTQTGRFISGGTNKSSRRKATNIKNSDIQCLDEDEDFEDFLHASSSVTHKVKKESDFFNSFNSLGGRSDVDSLENLELWPTWCEEPARRASEQRVQRRSTSVSLDERKTGEHLMTTSSFQRFVSRPSSPRRIMWDLISVFVMGYDVIRIPLEVFEMPLGSVELYSNLTTTIFWTFDICASFFAGYHVGGLIEMRPIRVALHYFRTWFSIDLLVVTIDWGVIAFRADDVEAIGLMRLNKTFRFVRVLRVLRFLRLVRMLKIRSAMSDLHDMIHSECLLTFITICQYVVGILVINHYLACGWYGLGLTSFSSKVEHTDSNSWISVSRNLFLDQNGGIKNPPLDYFYFTCLHWSLSQFTPASMEVVPCNSVERVYAIAVLLFAVLLFSSLLSSITTSMIALRSKSAERRKQQSDVRRYITEKRVTLDLGNRIAGFLRAHNFNVKSRKCVFEDDVSAFKILPGSLRSQLRYEVHAPNLQKHPFFDHLLSIESDETFGNICNQCCKEADLAYGQEMFACGARAQGMYVTVRGDCMYYQGSANKSSRIQPRAFISESVLWMTWDHKGRLVACEHAELVSMSSVGFRMVCRRSPLWAICKCYASRFHQKIIECLETPEDNLTDLGEKSDRLEELMDDALQDASEGYDLKHCPNMITPRVSGQFLRRSGSFTRPAKDWISPSRWWGRDKSPRNAGPDLQNGDGRPKFDVYA